MVSYPTGVCQMEHGVSEIVERLPALKAHMLLIYSVLDRHIGLISLFDHLRSTFFAYKHRHALNIAEYPVLIYGESDLFLQESE